jgi:hypothetical protein
VVTVAFVVAVTSNIFGVYCFEAVLSSGKAVSDVEYTLKFSELKRLAPFLYRARYKWLKARYDVFL